MEQLLRLAERQHGVFSAAQATERGVGPDVLTNIVAAGRLERLGRGVYRVVGSRRTHRQMVMAAVLAAGRGAVASHRTAAWLLGMPGFTARGIEVCRPKTKSHRGPIGFVHRSGHLPPEHVTVIDGIPCTTAPRTLFDLGAVVKRARCARAVDNTLTSGGVSFRTLADVFVALAKRGRTGTRAMRSILAQRGPDYVAPASELEAVAYEVLTGAGIVIEKQANVGGDDKWIGRVDFRVRGTRVLIEADGRRYHSSHLDRAADQRRDEELIAAGWIVVRLTWEMLTDRPHEAVQRVREAIRAAA